MTSPITSSTNVLNSDGSITQTERLFTTRARYGHTKYLSGDSSDLGGNRGQWAYIKLVTSDTQYNQYKAKSSPRNISQSLIGPNGDLTKMSDVTGANTLGYDKFLITGVSGQISEKTQISEVFGDHEVVYYFGRRPIILNISGVLIDSPDNNWFHDWITIYTAALRGTELARNYEMLELVLPNMVVTGSISGFSWNQSSSNDVQLGFGLDFIVKKLTPTKLDASGMATSNGLKFVDFSQAAKFTSQKGINSLKNQERAVLRAYADPSVSLANRASLLANLGNNTAGTQGILAKTNAGINSAMSFVNGLDAKRVGVEKSIRNSSVFNSINSTLTGIRLQVLSPAYGVLVGLTKLVKNSTGSALRLMGTLTSGIIGVIQGVTDIANQVTALANSIPQSISDLKTGFSNNATQIKNDLKTAFKAIKQAKGAVSHLPENSAQAILKGRYAGIGGGAAFLTYYTPKLAFARPVLSIGSVAPTPSREKLLSGVTSYSTSKAKL